MARGVLAGALVALCCGAGFQSGAVELALPVGASLTAERSTALDSFDAPLAAFDGAKVPVVSIEGAVSRRAWRISSSGLTALQIMLPLREQLEAQGFDVVFECSAKACGGFDFRFDIEVLPSPNMYVNISGFRYLTAIKGPVSAPEVAIGVLASVAATSAYVQVIHAQSGIDMQEALPVLIPAPTEPETLKTGEVPVPAANASALVQSGHVILSDLDFETGTSSLGQGPYDSLEQLANILRDNPEFRVALVGHTDAVGSLEANISLSRQRAQSVKNRLVETFGIASDRLDAEGMGYLSPIAPNLTDDGRDRNRRVEAVLLNTE